jgi:acyl carrier protein
MLDPADLKNQLRTFICRELIRNPNYPLRDDEPLVTGGLIDSFAIAQVGVFAEKAFKVYVPDTELTVDNMDSVEKMAACVIATSAKGR